MSRRARLVAWIGIAIVALGGCAGPPVTPLPTHEWIDAPHAMDTLRERATLIDTLSATCRLVLRSADGETVRLDGAIVCRPPDRVRLRAWKMGQTVFDLLATPEGAWAWAPDADDPAAALREIGVRADRLAEAMAYVTGGFVDGARVVGLTDDSLVVERPTAETGARVRGVIDRRTLTPREAILLDSAGRERYRLTFEDYVVIDSHLLATSMSGRGEEGRFSVRLDEIEVNVEPAEGAFVPAAGAVRLPSPPGGDDADGGGDGRP